MRSLLYQKFATQYLQAARPVNARCLSACASVVVKRSFSTTTAKRTSARAFSIWNPAAKLTSSPGQQDSLSPILASNKSWASHVASKEPDFFPNLSQGQSPHILWLGCSDSRVPETTLLGLKPGDVFVHRNIANILPATDLSSLAVIEYAVVYLKVKHIVVCGHSSCGGVAAALGNKKLGKIDAWLQPLRQIRHQHAAEIEKAGAEGNKLLVELNVKQGVETIRQNSDVIDAAKERGLEVHGMVYDLASGELKRVDTKEDDQSASTRSKAFACT